MREIKKYISGWLISVLHRISTAAKSFAKWAINTIYAIIRLVVRSAIMAGHLLMSMLDPLLAPLSQIVVLIVSLFLVSLCFANIGIEKANMAIVVVATFIAIFSSLIVNGAFEWHQYSKNKSMPNVDELVTESWDGQKKVLNYWASFISLLALWAAVDPNGNYSYLSAIRTSLDAEMGLFKLDLNLVLFLCGAIGFGCMLSADLYESTFRKKGIVKSIWEQRPFKDNK